MLRNYFKIAFRSLTKNKVSSFINISGLDIGMAVAMLIGLWIYDEISFNTFHKAIIIFVISFQAMKAAIANPVKSLRME